MRQEPLWTWADLCSALDRPVVQGPAVTGISIDSRTVRAGDLFVALAGDPGPRFNTHSRSVRDGHDFIAEAVARGASGVLVHRDSIAAAPTAPRLRVEDTLDALWALGRAARRRLGADVFAITGSSGKTTARTWLMAALDCHGSEGSFNNFWGVPLSLARTPADASAAVFEIGTNHPGEIAPLARMVAPDVAVVLNVGLAHIENFSGPDALRREKLSICEGLAPSGIAILPDGLDQGGVSAALTVLTFGESPAADVRLLDYHAAERTARFATPSGEVLGTVPGGGRHRAMTLAAVLGALCASGRSPQLGAALGESLVPAGRGRRETIGAVTLIDDSYNANPASMAAALTLLSESVGPRIAILGEMLELGGDSAAYHRNLANTCRDLDGIVCVGAGMRPLYEALTARQRVAFAERAADVDLELLGARLANGACVLLKGSNRVFWATDFPRRLRDWLGSRNAS